MQNSATRKNGHPRIFMLAASLILITLLSGCRLVERNQTPVARPVRPAAVPAQIPATTPDTTQIPTPTSTPTPTPTSSLPASISLAVPFTIQAPFQNWTDFYNEACEEAALITVIHYLENEGFTQKGADEEIIALADYETENGYAIDVTIQELSQIAVNYYKKQTQIFTGTEVTAEKIKELLNQNHPVIIPAAGQLLGNPNFRGDGPPYHMLVIRGYDDKYFYTNDPGTRHGENYRYDQQVLLNAIHDWTGDKATIETGEKAMMIVW